MMYRQIVPYILVVVILFALACSKTEYPRSKESANNLPDASFDDATIILTKDGRQDAIVKAKHIDRWDAKDSTEAEIVFITLYDSLGVEHSNLTSKRALLREQAAKFSLYGDVVGVSKDSTVLKTQSLFWDPKTELVTTDDYVEIRRADGDILKGWGLRADRDLQNIEIARNVSGNVKNVPESDMQNLEGKSGGANDSAEHQ
jgi:LPS export ABC transporter protein LptC